MSFELTWLPDVLLAAGLKVAEVPGWRDRGRSPMGTVRGVMCHHTVGAKTGNMPTLDLLIHGRSDLPGPLSQLGLGRDGTFYVVAAGRANHAGKGTWQGVSGNSAFIGIEGENAGGKNDAWPAVQMDAYQRGVAALLRHIGAQAIMCCGHKEYAPKRKPVDPRFDMDAFRAAVAELMGGAAPAVHVIPAANDEGLPTLRRGARGDDVANLQQRLRIAVDGRFGGDTEAAVRDFQRAHDLVPDGIVGPRTWVPLLAG